tara:strand:+ start:746 stop:904 length:159 start_codon:yes stop_codon:yes gene_type:complete
MKLSFTFLFSFSLLFSQKTDLNNTDLKELENMLESASRTGRVVMVEDFTGLS